MVLHPVDDHTRPSSLRNQTAPCITPCGAIGGRLSCPSPSVVFRTSQQEYAIEQRCDGAALGQMLWHHRPMCIWEAPVGALDSQPGTNGREIATRARKGFVGGEPWMALLSSEAKHMPGKRSSLLPSIPAGCESEPNEGDKSTQTLAAEQGKEKRILRSQLPESSTTYTMQLSSACSAGRTPSETPYSRRALAQQRGRSVSRSKSASQGRTNAQGRASTDTACRQELTPLRRDEPGLPSPMWALR
jgi:hypothetical protein